MTVASVGDVTKTFGLFTAVDHADLVVQPGEIVGLLGANGAGKTTLIKMLLGLLTPTSGEVRLFGEPPGIEQRRRIGYVPQNLGLYTDLTVNENLEFRAEVFGTEAQPMGGPDADRLIGTLPLGTQRRAAFHAALQHRPDLLVLDEPTSGVSPLARSELWDLIRTEADRGVGVLASTHYMDEAVQADRLVVMTSGRIGASGTAGDIVGDRTTLVVHADRWADAFMAIDALGWEPMLAGRAVRIPASADVEAHEVASRLRELGVTAEIEMVPATLEEVMVELSR